MHQTAAPAAAAPPAGHTGGQATRAVPTCAVVWRMR
jgi:hypothetical protein